MLYPSEYSSKSNIGLAFEARHKTHVNNSDRQRNLNNQFGYVSDSAFIA
jgi:hypothetical protein